MSVLLVLAMLTSVLVAIYRSGQVRAMAIGFGVFSSGFLLFEGGWLPGRTSITPLPTDDLIEWSFEKVHPSPDDVNAIASSGTPQPDPFVSGGMMDTFRAYKAVCIATIGMVTGFIGGALAQGLRRTPRDPRPSSA